MTRFYSIVEQDVCVMNESTTQARVKHQHRCGAQVDPGSDDVSDIVFRPAWPFMIKTEVKMMFDVDLPELSIHEGGRKW
jgi:hypothetical protein